MDKFKRDLDLDYEIPEVGDRHPEEEIPDVGDSGDDTEDVSDTQDTSTDETETHDASDAEEISDRSAEDVNEEVAAKETDDKMSDEGQSDQDDGDGAGNLDETGDDDALYDAGGDDTSDNTAENLSDGTSDSTDAGDGVAGDLSDNAASDIPDVGAPEDVQNNDAFNVGSQPTQVEQGADNISSVESGSEDISSVESGSEDITSVESDDEDITSVESGDEGSKTDTGESSGEAEGSSGEGSKDGPDSDKDSGDAAKDTGDGIKDGVKDSVAGKDAGDTVSKQVPGVSSFKSAKELYKNKSVKGLTSFAVKSGVDGVKASIWSVIAPYVIVIGLAVLAGIIIMAAVITAVVSSTNSATKHRANTQLCSKYDEGSSAFYSGEGSEAYKKMGAKDKLYENADALARDVSDKFPEIKTIGGWREEGGYADDHEVGRAIDFMTSDKALGDKVEKYVHEVGKKYNLEYTIWRQELWVTDSKKKKMEDRGDETQNHFDHVHVSVWEGEKKASGPSSGGSSDSSQSTSGNTEKNAETIWKFLHNDTNWTPQQIAGAIGNMTQESQLDPEIVNPSSGAFGIAQWYMERLTGGSGTQGLIPFAKAQGGSHKDLNIQLKYLSQEYSGSYENSMLAAKGFFSKKNDIEATTNAWAFGFERMGENEAAMGQRYAFAKKWYAMFGDKDFGKRGKNGASGSTGATNISGSTSAATDASDSSGCNEGSGFSGSGELGASVKPNGGTGKVLEVWRSFDSIPAEYKKSIELDPFDIDGKLESRQLLVSPFGMSLALRGQCTELTWAYMNLLWEGVMPTNGNGGDIWSAYKSAGAKVTTSPTVGYGVSGHGHYAGSGGSTSGHTAVVVGVLEDGKWISANFNYDSPGSKYAAPNRHVTYTLIDGQPKSAKADDPSTGAVFFSGPDGGKPKK